MCDQQKQEMLAMREALRAAVTAAINEIGLAAFKRTSLFMSNHAALNEQVAG